MRRLQTRFISDISRYTENFFLGMSPRQTFFGIAGAACMTAGPLFVPGPDILPMLIGFALIAAGFFRPDGLPPEKFLKAWLDARFVNPPRRCYAPDNIAHAFLWEGRIGGRVCFRPQDYLKEDKKLLQNQDTAPSAMTDADWPETELAAQTAPPEPPQPQSPQPEPPKSAPAAPAKTPAKKAPAKKPAAKSRSTKKEPPEPLPQDILLPRPRPRVPTYGAGREGGRR